MTDENVECATFNDRKTYEASKDLERVRSKKSSEKELKQTPTSVWDIKPVDFSLRLYHPRPPKRNTREAIKPWTYDRYLRSMPESSMSNDQSTSTTIGAKLANKVALNFLLGYSLSESLKNDPVDIDSSDVDDNDEGEYYDLAHSLDHSTQFRSSFRLLTPNRARIEASKTMSFRDGLDQFKNPIPHDFRGLKEIYGMPKFRTRFEKDTFNLRFLTEHLNKIHGYENQLQLRVTDSGQQMGDRFKKAEPKYDSRLILPRLPFPNKFHGYTRHRRRDRSVTSAYWDRVLARFSNQQQQPSSHQ